jgi:hypothetical protein
MYIIVNICFYYFSTKIKMETIVWNISPESIVQGFPESLMPEWEDLCRDYLFVSG